MSHGGRMIVQYDREKDGRDTFSASLRCLKAITTASRLPGLIAVLSAMIVLGGCMSEDLTRARYVDPPANQSKSNVGSLTEDSARAAVNMNEIIRPGDQVQVMVWGYPEFNTTTTVKVDGTIAVPLVGDVIAAGLTENQLALQVKQRLGEYVKGDPRVTISHMDNNRRVSVMGAVNKQGNYLVLMPLPLTEVIAAAEGPSTDADLRHVKIFHNGHSNEYQEVDLEKYLENGSVQNVPKVGPGDTVFIPKQENFVRELSGYAQDVVMMFGFFTLLR